MISQAFASLWRGLKAVFVLSGLGLNLIILPLMDLLVILVRFILPIPCLKLHYDQWIHVVFPEVWVAINSWLITAVLNIKWDVQGSLPCSKEGWYLLLSNHYSAVDILVLDRVFTPRIPKVKFFMKQALLWQLPILGWVCYLLGNPFLKRHQSKRDIRAIQEACSGLSTRPTTLASFVEGTRGSEKKRLAARSPYRHLLKPNLLTVAMGLVAFQDKHPIIVDVTLAYDNLEQCRLIDLVLGRIKKISVRYQQIPFEQFAGLDAEGIRNKAKRDKVKAYLQSLWQAKDDEIEMLISSSVKSSVMESGS